jgi:hypothetical protein
MQLAPSHPRKLIRSARPEGVQVEQHTAKGSMLGSGNWSLIPPLSEDFEAYGGADTVARARNWALENQYLLYQGPAQTCVHGPAPRSKAGRRSC